MTGQPSVVDLPLPGPISKRGINAMRNHQEAAEKRTVLESRPRMVFVELTRSCNLTCPMCRPVLMSGRQLAMPASVLSRVEEELFPYAEVVDLRGFGESALDNRLVGLTKKLISQGTETKILTNLSVRKPAYWSEFGSLPILVGISLEAAGAEDYEATRVGARWDRFLANLAALRHAQLQSRRDDIYFNVVVSEDNLDKLTALVQLAHDSQVPLITLNPISRTEHGAVYPETGVRAESWHALDDALLRAEQHAAKLGVELRVGANLAWGRQCGGGYDQCLHPWSYVFIRYDGGVGFCDHLVAHDESILGSIATSSFMEAWNSELYVNVRREHAERRFDRLAAVGIECDWCYENRYVDREYAIEPSLKTTSVPQYLDPDS